MTISGSGCSCFPSLNILIRLVKPVFCICDQIKQHLIHEVTALTAYTLVNGLCRGLDDSTYRSLHSHRAQKVCSFDTHPEETPPVAY